MSTTEVVTPVGLVTLREAVRQMSKKIDRALSLPCPNCGHVLSPDAHGNCLNLDCPEIGFPG